MELFKTKLSKEEFERVKNKTLVDVLKCGLCHKSSCKNHHRFFVDCDWCRKSWCHPCKIFICAKKTLLKNLDDNGKKYLDNFIRRFLNLSDESFQKFYDKEQPISIPRSKTFDVKSYHKSDKNRSQVVYKNFDW